jgi:hypothetical protein
MTVPIEENDYQEYASQPLDHQDMEALAANAEQGADMDQAIVHNMYIGWVMGVARTHEFVEFEHMGGNLISVKIAEGRTVQLIVPYPPKEWTP